LRPRAHSINPVSRFNRCSFVYLYPYLQVARLNRIVRGHTSHSTEQEKGSYHERHYYHRTKGAVAKFVPPGDRLTELFQIVLSVGQLRYVEIRMILENLVSPPNIQGSFA